MNFEESAEYWWHRAEFMWKAFDKLGEEAGRDLFLAWKDAAQKAEFLMHAEAKASLRDEIKEKYERLWDAKQLGKQNCEEQLQELRRQHEKSFDVVADAIGFAHAMGVIRDNLRRKVEGLVDD